MKYKNIRLAQFISRPNRFVAQVLSGGQELTVHVKNTGRCRELLLPGAQVALAAGQNPARKTPYDLVAVYKQGLGWVNIDSQAPNAVMAEWLAGQGFSLVRPETTFGNSRFDFYLEKGGQRFFVEVKGCTLERNGVGYFPDAPTLRGVKHCNELALAAGQGYRTALAFVIALPGVTQVLPNMQTHPQFGRAVVAAMQAGVEVWLLPCRVGPDQLEIIGCLQADASVIEREVIACE